LNLPARSAKSRRQTRWELSVNRKQLLIGLVAIAVIAVAVAAYLVFFGGGGSSGTTVAAGLNQPRTW